MPPKEKLLVVRYESPAGKLVAYQSPDPGDGKKRPAIVLVHGGAFSFGDKQSPELVDLANYLGRRGIVSVSIDYRLLAPRGCVGPDDPTVLCTDAARAAQSITRSAAYLPRA